VGSTPVAGAGELSAFQIPGLDAYIQKLEAAKKKSRELGDTTSDVFQEMANKAAQTVGSGLVTALEGIINGTQSAEDAFKQLGLTVVNELKNMALAALQNSLFGQNGTFGGGGGTAGLVVGIGSALLQAFGEGGVMTSSGPMTLRRYAGGGIAGTPQLAMFGEGSTPEAFVPLPNGRSIPVSLGGGVGNSINASFSSAVTVNVDGGRGDVSDPEQARELGATVSRAVRAEFNELLRDATRPGGTLNPQGFSRN
jgi:anti-sigma factor RsiW